MSEKPKTETFVISDDLLTGQSPPTPPPSWVPPTISESLHRDSNDEGSEFYLVDGRPCVVKPNLDLAYDYSTHPIKEINSFAASRGTRIDRKAFVEKVCAIHQIENFVA